MLLSPWNYSRAAESHWTPPHWARSQRWGSASWIHQRKENSKLNSDATPMAYTGHPFISIVQQVLGSFIGLSKNFGSSFSFSSQRSLQPTLQKPSAKTSNTAPSAPCQLQQVVSFIFQFLGMAHLLCHRAVFAQLQNLLVLTASLGRPELSNAQVSVTSIYSVYPLINEPRTVPQSIQIVLRSPSLPYHACSPWKMVFWNRDGKLFHICILYWSCAVRMPTAWRKGSSMLPEPNCFLGVGQSRQRWLLMYINISAEATLQSH